MSELRRPGDADDADKPAVNDKAADNPAERPRLEIRTADMNADWPVDRRAVTKAQRHYIDLVKQGGDLPPGDTDPGYVRDWATGESLDHNYPHITGAKDRTEPGDPFGPPDPPDPPGDGRPAEFGSEPPGFPENEGGWRGNSGRWMVLEEHLGAEHNIDRVREAEPRITSDLREIESAVDGANLIGLDHRLKSDERLKDKIAERVRAEPDRSIWEIADNIPDSIRDTFQFDATDYTRGYQEVRHSLESVGYTLVHNANSWDSPDYKGLNTRWRTPDGALFELQFHTPESFAAKQETHDLYEKMRNPATPPGEVRDARAAKREIVAEIPVPSGAESIRTFKQEG